MLEILYLGFLVVYCVLKALKYYGVPENFPPGPPAVPLFGVLPFVRGDFKSSIQEWKETYGDIVGVSLGTSLAVVISDFDVLSSSFRDSRFTGRPKNLQTVMSAFFASDKDSSNGGIVFTHGKEWTEQRRFALKTLRDFGFGKNSMEDVILNEVNALTDVLASKYDCDDNNNLTKSNNDDGAVDVSDSGSLCHGLSVSVVNSIWQIITGERIPHGNKTVQEIVDGTDNFIKNESLSGPIMMMPWLRHVPGIKEKFQESRRAPLKMRQLQDRMVASHSQKRKKTECSKDFIDAYLEKIDSTTDSSSSFHGKKGMTNLQRTLTDLFGAGSETTSSMLLFAFLYMIKYPEVQEKIRAEVESVCGSSTLRVADRKRMPYTDAVLHEVFRHACLVYTVPHATTCDVDLEGFNLPEGTAVYANVWHVMHNKEYWDRPEEFLPERFLDPETGAFRKDERCIPFMLGKRFCIGQSLAQLQLFLFFAGLLRNFEFSSPGGPEAVCISPVVGFIHRCPQYEVSIRKRRRR